MMRECLDIGTMQAFLDGETSPELTVRLSDHVAGCDACATALSIAEEENSTVFSVLDREMNALVPTQRLWGRITDSIESERSRISYWAQARRFLSLQVASPALTAAVGILVFFGLFASVYMFRPGTDIPVNGTAVTKGERPVIPDGSNGDIASGRANNNLTVTQTADTGDEATSSKMPEEGNAVVAMTAVHTTQVDRRAVQRVNDRPRPMTLKYIPGEESYIRTIDELNESVEVQKERVLPPSSRIAFERDLAVVNDAIKKMQRVVRRDPRNQAARQVLYSAYQDKIDLLNSVGQREELMASLQ